MALSDFVPALQHREEAQRFAAAAQEPEIRAKLAQLEREFESADRDVWPE